MWVGIWIGLVMVWNDDAAPDVYEVTVVAALESMIFIGCLLYNNTTFMAVFVVIAAETTMQLLILAFAVPNDNGADSGYWIAACCMAGCVALIVWRGWIFGKEKKKDGEAKKGDKTKTETPPAHDSSASELPPPPPPSQPQTAI